MSRNLSEPVRNLLAAITPAQQLNEQFTRIYTQFQPRITRLVQHEVRDGNHALAEDLTADAFFRAWLDLHKCRATTDAQMYGWLASVARRTVMAHYRTKKNTAETPADLGHYSFANREMEPAAGYYTPAATGFRTATWSDDDNKPVIPRIPGPRKPTASTGDVCPLCEYFRCRCKSAQAAAHPGDSDPNPDEALRRVQGKPAPIRQTGGAR